MNPGAQTLATRIVERIFKDLRDRRTLKHLFAEGDAYEKIDDETQNEIHGKWRAIVVSELRKAGVLE